MTAQELQTTILQSKVIELLNKIEKIQTDFVQAQNQSDNEIKPIKEAFSEKLASTWTNLAQKLAKIENWQNLNVAVTECDEFLSNLHQVVLQPRRTKLATQLTNWLSTWTKTKVPWDQFIEKATDEELNELSILLEREEVSNILDLDIDLLQKIWIEWVEYQVNELKQKQQSYNNLKSWLEHFLLRLLEACDLDDFILDLPKSFDQHDTIKTVQEMWLNNCLAELSKLKAKQPDLGLKDKHTGYEMGWKDLQIVLTTLKVSLQGLTERELSLVDKEIDDWKQVDREKIQALIKTLEQVVKLKKRARETPQLSTVKPLTKPALKPVEKLVKDQPKPVDPTKSKTLEVYLEHLKKADEKLTEWLVEFDQVLVELQQEISRWKRLPADHEFSKELMELENSVNNLNSLETVIQVHNNIVVLSKKIRDFLEQELNTSQRNALEIILQLRASGYDRFSVTDLAAKLQTENYLEILQNLSEKNFISLDITIR